MYTWKNVDYADGSGLVDSIRKSNAQMAENDQAVVDSISGFGDDYSKLQTDAFISELMQYKDDTDKVQGMINDADTSWLDMARVSDARDLANKRSDELSMYGAKQDILHKNAMELAQAKAKADAEEAAKKKNKGLSVQGLSNALSKVDKSVEETPPILGWFGADTPKEEVMDRINKFISAKGITGKEADLARKDIFENMYLDKNWFNEFKTANKIDIEDTKDSDLQEILNNARRKK